jgi:branched-subunit amino acid transport system permease
LDEPKSGSFKTLELHSISKRFGNLQALSNVTFELRPGTVHALLGENHVENPEAAIAAGIQASRVQFAAILFGGFMGGVAEGVLVIAQAGTFAEGMSAGRGFIAIAIVVLGRWHPAGVALSRFRLWRNQRAAVPLSNNELESALPGLPRITLCAHVARVSRCRRTRACSSEAGSMD